MKFTLKLADVPIGIEHRFPYIAELCADYMTSEPPAFTVSVTEEMIDDEALASGISSRELAESTAVHRAVVGGLVRYGAVLMHSATVEYDGRAYAFMAKSGVGKSTHIALWREVYGDRVSVVNGDKPMFSFVDGVFTAHGTPWRGKEGLGENVSFPVGAICFLERAEKNSIRRAAESEVIGRIFHQVLVPDNAVDVAIFMGIMDRVLRSVPFYILGCNMEKEAAEVSCRGMTGGEK